MWLDICTTLTPLCSHPTVMYNKLLKLNINGPILNSMTNIYKTPQRCIQLNGELSDWFNVESGVRQADSLSPLLFCMFIYALALETNDINIGVYMEGEQGSSLMYADDIVIIGPNVDSAQKQLDVLNEWGNKW